MNIAILGTGNVGATLGRRWAAEGHHVCFGSRDPDGPKARELAASTGTRVATWSTAIDSADLVVLALPWPAVLDVCRELAAALTGKILVDCVNPLNRTFTGLELGHTSSAAEQIAMAAPDSRVVKAFNMVSAATMADPKYGQQAATLFYCGDDTTAKGTVHQLAEELGFAPVDTGPLVNARLLEPLAMLYIYLAFHGWGSNCAFQVVRR